MMASLPNARQKGVSPVDVQAVVLYAHKTPRSLSSQIPFAPLSQVLIILSKNPFITLTCPLAYGWVSEK